MIARRQINGPKLHGNVDQSRMRQIERQAPFTVFLNGSKFVLGLQSQRITYRTFVGTDQPSSVVMN